VPNNYLKSRHLASQPVLALAHVEVRDSASTRTGRGIRDSVRGAASRVAKGLAQRGLDAAGVVQTARAIGVSESMARSFGDPQRDGHDLTIRDTLAAPVRFQIEIFEGGLALLGEQVDGLPGLPFAEQLLDIVLLASEALRLYKLAWTDVRQIPTGALEQLLAILDKLGAGCRAAAREARRELARRTAQ
jgi:hypothetical protein